MHWREVVFISAPILFFGAYGLTDLVTEWFFLYSYESLISSTLIMVSIGGSIFTAFSYGWYLSRKGDAHHSWFSTAAYYSGILPLFLLSLVVLFAALTGKW